MPYVIALFSAMLMIYYALIKSNSFLLITINGIGCLVETVYIVLFLVFAPKKTRVIISCWLSDTMRFLLGEYKTLHTWSPPRGVASSSNWCNVLHVLLQISTLKLLLGLNVVAYSFIVGLTLLLVKGSARVHVIGWINVGFSLSVFAAPLTIMVSTLDPEHESMHGFG